MPAPHFFSFPQKRYESDEPPIKCSEDLGVLTNHKEPRSDENTRSYRKLISNLERIRSREQMEIRSVNT